ncbi:hypothetical protein FF011L_32160 [Roseimaritima multifibrata]|uniref:Rhodanese domain-containing protein n=2 Tax=Roseimaritima multifibrata TaxID=1930274 RepID=A0A517MI15_9BACT|nr:hypothetical protein FF011L_32160 [Roseimaritima multifibrata]
MQMSRSNPIRIKQWISRFIVGACDRGFAIYDRIHTLLKHPSIESVSTAELRASQLDGGKDSYVLVDVRSENEQAISRIPGAITAKDYETNRQSFSGRTIVPYCTVGGRSYLYARHLASLGIPTKNYRESILGWCKAGYVLESPTGFPTRNVHPYWRIFDIPADYEISKK